MLFNSYIFIFFFLPVTLIGYFLLNHVKRYSLAKLYLTGMSLWFYAYFHTSYLWIILFSILLNYGCHLLLLRQKYCKPILVAGLLANVGLLFYYKYFNFLLTTLNQVFHTRFSLLGVLMPLGISFFTFQQIGFLVDTAKGKIEKQKPLDYALFVSFFPQLIAGPIVSHEEMLPQFADESRKKISIENFYQGLRIFVLGLSKKVLIADTFGKAVDWGFSYYTVLDGLNTFLIILFYTLQIYFDFSGYCDMARGIGYLFNIKLPVNFNSPYKSKNIVEFWDRWHMTLTRFFTRYLYIPLGGNRKGTLRTYINVMIVFFVSGFWHGAGFTFILWGVMHGVATVVTRMWFAVKKKYGLNRGGIIGKTAAVLSTFLFVAFAWTFFRADSIGQAWEMVTNVFTKPWNRLYLEIAGFFQLPELWNVMRFLKLDTLPYASYYCMLAFVTVTAWITFGCKNIAETEETHRPGILYTLMLVILAVWCIMSLSEVSSFLYFNF